ncbi:MAG TPA: hypothetical protein VIG51_05945 [Candidatus Baltobacteraceae bacterium]
MKHLDAGELRRMIDEPNVFSRERRAHARTCALCAPLGAELRANAEFAANLLTDAPPRRRPVAWAAFAAVAAAAVLVAGIAFTPVGSYAGGFLTIFQPKQFTTVDVSKTDLQNFKFLPQADKLGTRREMLRPRRLDVASLKAAQSHVDFALLHPTSVPASVGHASSFGVETPGRFSFTFSASKAAAYAKRQHAKLPPMPRDLNGTTVRVATGSMVVASYGAHPPRHLHKAMPTGHLQPFLMFVQARAPRVTSTGATLPVLERYLLAMPGIPPQLATQIRALGDLGQTLPIPIRPDKQTAQRVTVQGAQGLAIGDNTGLGAGIVWQKNGIIYGVAGPLREDDVLAFANGLQ